MAKAQPFNYYGYRFHAQFWRRDSEHPIPLPRISGGEVGFSSIIHGPAGLEFWTAHLENEAMLYTRLEGVHRAEVTLMPRGNGPARVIGYDLADPRILGVSINARPLTVQLDASESSVALDGILFEQAKVSSINHHALPIAQ